MSRRDWLAIAGVLLVALFCRAVYLWQFSQLPDWDQLTVDNWYHHHWATTIAGGNVLGDTTYFRAPMYAWCLGAVYALFGASLWAARIFGLGIGLGSVLFTYFITRRLTGHRGGLIAAFIQSIYPLSLMFEAELLLDPLFALTVQMLVLSLLRWWDNPTATRFLAVAVAGGIAALTRPTILVVMPFIVIVALWKHRHSAAVAVRHFAVAVMGFALTVGVVFARNIAVAGDPVLVASQGGINFYIGNNDAADGASAIMPEPLGHNWRIQDVTYIAEHEAGKALKPGEVSSYWTGKAIGWISDHPWQFTQLTVRRLWYSISNVEIANNRFVTALVARIPILHFNPVCFGVIFILAAIGVGAFWRSSQAVRWLCVGLLFVTLVNSLFFMNSRFRLPVIPLYIALAGMAVDYALRSYRTIWRDRTLLLVAATSAILTFTPFFRLSGGFSIQDLLSKGLMLYNRGDYTGALGYYRSAASYDSAFPETNLNIGATLLKLGEVDSATAYFEREIALHPGRSLGYNNLAAIRLIQNEFAGAQSLALVSLKGRPYDPTAWIVMIRAVANDSSVSADSLYRLCRNATANTKHSPRVGTEAGSALDARGNADGAVEMYLLASRLGDAPLETDDRMFEQGYPQAVARDRRERAKAEMSLGSLFGRRGEYAQAAVYSSRAITLDSALCGAWVNLASAYFSLGRNAEATLTLNQAQEKCPNDPLIKSLVARLSP